MWILKYLWSLAKALIYWGRWLKTFIPDIQAPLLNFDKLVIGRCKLLLFLVLYLWISLFVSNRCLLLTAYKTNEYMCWEYNVIISRLLKTSPQESLSPVSYNSDNFLLEYKYLVGVGGATPKNYTIAYNRVYMSKIDYS